MKGYLRGLAALAVTVLSFGLVGPALISSASDVGVLAGVGVVAATLPLLAWLTKPWWRQIGKIAIVGAVAGLAVACSRVESGHVGVKVHKLGGAKGVDMEVVGPGRYWIGWNEELHLFPTYKVTDTWARTDRSDQSITFQSVEGLSANADVGVTFLFKQDKIARIFQEYRRGVNEISDLFLRNLVRDAFVTAASTRPIEAVYGAGKAELIAEVEKMVRAQVEPLGIVVENIYVVGDFRLPQTVIAAINAKIQATQFAQQRQNEVAAAKAEADKVIEAARGLAESVRIQAEAQAEANRKLAASITDNLVRYEAIKKWDGVQPRVASGSVIPMVDLK